MEQRTCNIIMCCKGSGEGKHPKERIINYLLKECMVDKAFDKDELLLEFLKQAVLDYIDGCDKPSYFLWQMCNAYVRHEENMDRTQKWISKIIAAFSILQVLDESGYINGFDREQIKVSESILGGI